MSAKRFTVVDLGTQIDSKRRFAVWVASTQQFWKINNRQAWMYVDDLIADFKEHLPPKKLQVFIKQRDEIAEQAFLLGFDRESP